MIKTKAQIVSLSQLPTGQAFTCRLASRKLAATRVHDKQKSWREALWRRLLLN